MAEEYELRLVQHRSKRMKKQNSSFMSDVKDDILMEILLRLPHGRSAIQTSLICKQWGSLIFSDYFIKRFSQPHHGSGYIDPSYALPFTLLFKFELGFVKSLASFSLSPEITLDFLPEPWPRTSSTEVSSGDLLLLYDAALSPKEFCVCNPVTQQWSIVSFGDTKFSRLPLLIPGLCRDPSKPFGDHKVVFFANVTAVGDDFSFEMAIFCSATRRWSNRSFTLRRSSLELGFGPFIDHAVTSQGVLYFPLRMNWLELSGFLAIDPAANRAEARFVALPSRFFRGSWGRNGSYIAGVVRDRLRLSQMVTENDDVISLKVWELCCDGHSDKYSWILVHNVNIDKYKVFESIYVLAFHPNNGDVAFVMLNEWICRYDMREGEFQAIALFQSLKTTSRLNVFSLLHGSLPGVPV